MYTITIPVKPYVKRYIMSTYECTNWKFTKVDRVGKYFYALLQKQPRIPDRYIKLGETLTIEINNKYAKNKGLYLSQEDVDDFNDFIYEEMIEKIVNYCWNIRLRAGVKKYDRLYLKQDIKGDKKIKQIQNPDISQFFEFKEIIYDFLQRYDISEDDLPFETVRKNVYRKLERLTTTYKSAS